MSEIRGLFEEQLFERNKRDSKYMSDALMDVADSLRGKSSYRPEEKSADNLRYEVETICQYYRAAIPSDYPDTKDLNELIDCIIGPSGVMRRRITLEGKWWKNGDGALLALRRDNGRFAALLPGRISGYYYYDENIRKNVKVNNNNNSLFEKSGLCFYRPLPESEIDRKGLLKFLIKNIPAFDYVMIVLVTLLCTWVGLLTPLVTGVIFSSAIPAGKREMAASAAFLLLGAAAAIYLMSVVKGGLLERVRGRIDNLLQNSVMSRVIRLPAGFFKSRSAGSLSESVTTLKILPDIIVYSILSPCITAVFSMVYIIQIAVLSPSFAFPSLVILICQCIIIFVSLMQRMRKTKAELEASGKTQDIAFAIIAGIQRIKLSGSEKRALTRWARVYKNKAKALYKFIFPSDVQDELVAAAALFGMLWVFAAGVDGGMSVVQFAVFMSSFSIITGNLSQLSTSAQMLAYLHPVLDMIEPVLKAVPESSTGKAAAGRLRGEIEVSHVTFRYSDKSPLILNDFSLRINPGEYLAIVGRSGCGKSTLLRLLMGFEIPETGSINYDSRNLNEIDPSSLRRSIGTVLQNGKLFSGDIFSNITISAPWLTLEDAWEAAEMAGIADDIRNMPMGMHTLISEGGGGISGGQKQRLMIARAIAPKPKILMFDEATSALDNITQRIVSDSLARLNCTRIVIAHRLSTIRGCDRIAVLDNGKIAEEGTYDQLMEKKGLFAELADRQLM